MMAIKYNQSKGYRNLTMFQITKMTEDEAWLKLKSIRWGNNGKVCCPICTKSDNHYFIKTRKQWTCRNCTHRFSVTSSSPFSSHKLSYVKILSIIYFFISSPQGLSANMFHAQIGTTLKTAFHNLNKIREVLYETMNRNKMEGIVHIDCAHFAGKPRRSNVRKKTDSYVVNNILRNRKDSIVPDPKAHPEPANIKRLTNRRILLSITQSDSHYYRDCSANRTMTFTLKSENSKTILPIINKHVSKNSIIMSDCGNAFSAIENELGITHFTVNHSKEYMTEAGISNNMSESFFSRMRRAEIGTHNGFRPQYFSFYAAEFGWRADAKNLSLYEKFEDLIKRIFTRETSKAFTNYNHGHRLGFEYLY